MICIILPSHYVTVMIIIYNITPNFDLSLRIKTKINKIKMTKFTIFNFNIHSLAQHPSSTKFFSYFCSLTAAFCSISVFILATISTFSKYPCRYRNYLETSSYTSHRI